MVEDRVYIEQMITGSFIRYNVLSQLISSSYAGSSATEINLFIDLNSVLKQMYAVSNWTYKYSSKYEITATILNMCGHYRSFFRSLGVYTNIYLIYGLNCPTINESYVPGYNSKFMTAYNLKQDTTALIQENLSILNIICQYLPRIYFFDIGTNEVSAMVDYIIGATKAVQRGLENIVLSKDVLMLQLIPSHNIRVIRPSKTKNGDESFIVDNSNLWDKFCVNYRKGKAPTEYIGSGFIHNILPMTRVPERDMFSSMSIPAAYNILKNGLKMGFLNNETIYTQSVINTVLQAMDVKCNPTELEMRYRAINTHYQSTFVLPLEKPEFKRLRLIDLEDIASLKEIITKYFYNVPIDLDKL